ncbi:MAG TPA: hypothetical protein O0X27_04290 [Methanocorpusculum sp.]|nr:hypothetical protein [Methanocorpusculum sp.]
MDSRMFAAGIAAGIVIVFWVAVGLLLRYLVNAGTVDSLVFNIFNGVMIVLLFLVPGLAIYISSRNQ